MFGCTGKSMSVVRVAGEQNYLALGRELLYGYASLATTLRVHIDHRVVQQYEARPAQEEVLGGGELPGQGDQIFGAV